jgi:hypothetical protein
MKLYNQLKTTSVEVAMAIHQFNTALGYTVMQRVVNPTDPEWKVTGLNVNDSVDGSHPYTWGNPELMGKSKPSSYLWSFPAQQVILKEPGILCLLCHKNRVRSAKNK